MKRVLYFFVLVVLICFVSCSAGSKDEPQIIRKSVSEIPKGSYVEFSASPTDEINLSDFTEEDGVLVSYVDGIRGIARAKDENSDLVITKNGLGMPVPHDDGNTSFPVDAISVGNSGKIRVEHFELSSDLEITQEEMASETTNGRPKTVNERGELVTEEFYRIDLKNGQYKGYDKDEVAIIQIIKGDIVDFSNPEYGFIKNGKIDLSTNGDEIHGLVDLSHKKAVTVFNTIEFKNGTNMLCKIALVIPHELIPNSLLNIDSNTNVYKIMKAGKTGNYVVEITTNGADPDNKDYHVVLRDNARARYIEGSTIGKRRVPNLIPISRTGEKIVLWVGEVDESFIFDCCIDGDDGYYGTIKLRSASADEEEWASTHVLSTESPLHLHIAPNTSGAYYLTGMNGEYTFEAINNDPQAFAQMHLLFGNKKDNGGGSMGFDHSLPWSSLFNEGFIIFTYWGATKEFDLDISLSNVIHSDIRFNPETSRFECQDEGCDKYFMAQAAGNLLVGKWQMTLDGDYAEIDITEWGDVPITVRSKGKEKTVHGTASYDPTTMQIFLDIPAPYKKHYELQSFCYGQSMTFTDGTVVEKVVE